MSEGTPLITPLECNHQPYCSELFRRLFHCLNCGNSYCYEHVAKFDPEGNRLEDPICPHCFPNYRLNYGLLDRLFKQ